LRETYEFRLLPEYGRLVFGPDYEPAKNPKTGSAEFIAEGVVGDDLYHRVQEADRSFAPPSESGLITGWNIKRIYTSAEIERAQLFLIQLSYAEGAGEEFGTWYTAVVPNLDCTFERIKKAYGHNQRDIIGCALSSHQVGPLRFPFQKMRRGCDIFATWAGELIVSKRLAKLIETGGFTGGKLNAIWNTGVEPKLKPDLSELPSGKELLIRAGMKGFGPSDKVFWSWIEEEEQLPLLDKALFEQMHLKHSRGADASAAQSYSQLIVQSTPLTVSSNTVIGSKPFRPQYGYSCKCGFGNVRGRMLISALSVIGSSWDGSDVCRSDVYVGGRAGLFRPSRLLVVSKRLFDAMRKEDMKGFNFEIVEML
jgi:hypothetical protein